MLFRNANFKHVPAFFAFVGISFWVVKGLLTVMEGGQLERIIGRFVTGGMEIKADERKLAAKAIVSAIKEQSWVSYILRIVFIHYTPFFYGTWIAIMMLYMINLRLSHDTMITLSNLLDIAYNMPVDSRDDKLLELFPRITVYEYHIYGPSGTYQNRDITCMQSLASMLELHYVVLLMTLLVILVLILLDTLIVVFFMTIFSKYGSTAEKSTSLPKGTGVILYLIQRNVDPLLMKEIWKQINIQRNDEGSHDEF